LDLLLYSRANRPDEQKELLNFNEIVLEFLQLRRKLIAEKKASINSSRLPVMETYTAPITQIFHCLLDNALKYAKEEVPPIIDIDVRETTDYWEFTIKDNGIGIDPIFFEKIFIIFQRLHNRNDYGGTGIGLSIAKRSIEFLGGRIWLTSEVDKGTTFYFIIPKTKI
jgi:light-regulated signal transduction histidine kinase (bacteriophytochrome)